MGIKLNVGCGRHVLDGWTNIDIQKSPFASRDPEYLCDMKAIPLPDGCADELMAIHVFEHFYLWEVPIVIAEWRRLLAVGGKIILEMPNLIKCCQNIVDGVGMEAGGKNPDALGLWGLYGDPRMSDIYMCHHWGWHPKSLRKFLSMHGFSKATEHETQWHRGGRLRRDMRMEAFKL